MNPLYAVRFIIIYTVVLIIGFSIMKSNAKKRNRPKKKTQGRLVYSRYVDGEPRSYYRVKYQFDVNGVIHVKTFKLSISSPPEFVTILYIDGVRDAEIKEYPKSDNSISAKILYCILIAPAIATLISNLFDMLSYIV